MIALMRYNSQQKCSGGATNTPERGRINQRLRRIDPTWRRIPRKEAGVKINGANTSVLTAHVLPFSIEVAARVVWIMRLILRGEREQRVEPQDSVGLLLAHAWNAATKEHQELFAVQDVELNGEPISEIIARPLSNPGNVRSVMSHQFQVRHDAEYVLTKITRRVGRRERRDGNKIYVRAARREMKGGSVKDVVIAGFCIIGKCGKRFWTAMARVVIVAAKLSRYFSPLTTFTRTAQRNVSGDSPQTACIPASLRRISLPTTKYCASTVTALKAFLRSVRTSDKEVLA